MTEPHSAENDAPPHAPDWCWCDGWHGPRALATLNVARVIPPGATP